MVCGHRRHFKTLQGLFGESSHNIDVASSGTHRLWTFAILTFLKEVREKKKTTHAVLHNVAF
jgi:hypothetical protein